MNLISRTVGAALGLMAFCFISAASAVPLLCKEAAANHALTDASHVRSCLAADLGDVGERIFSIDADRNELSIAVQPVGSDKLDHWFVQFLNPMLDSGDWRFAKVLDHDGRVTHIKLYGRAPAQNVPEPGALALLSVGLLGAALLGRRKRSRTA
ncbi:PEP-CTERM sorting domain-containing protein [Steroidobacter sp. S1-65]|uniref:PEP-CTERM sorting domain-containing protein n=1 Tax=Steroidobacter gossypii TaxID=2805490 RepID=A0ABS1X6F8_9GAMM|nr:PEP-CTERM sorting domain-containing protein [Steroidobacter gossypii]MBM0108803.1 PEP-CTERM sorting domain-containing protein [Steroidobacter gossypii]